MRRVAWLPATVVNELPLLAILFLGASTALAIADGNIDSAAGWVCVGIAALTVVGLLVVAHRATLARPALEHALKNALGPGARGAAEMPSPSRSALLAAGFAPWFTQRHGVKRVADLSYGDAGEENKLDLYARGSGRAGAPTLVYFHGGGYFSGAKSREARALLYRLAREGWTCISANYRLRPRADLFEQLVDAKRAIAWALRDAGGGEPGPLFVAGSSAGGHLAALAAPTPNEPELQPGFELVDTSVSGAICLYAYLGNYYGMGAESSPLGNIRPDAPPFFLAQGTASEKFPSAMTRPPCVSTAALERREYARYSSRSAMSKRFNAHIEASPFMLDLRPRQSRQSARPAG
ncbi:MAG TPA: alpha/beta hydrolase [Solirubrobacterales bacterium]|nr:alpha/beta hydrolase [Solirubrobacterales bacterium]